MKLLFENWRKYLNDGTRRKRIESLDDYDLSQSADDGFRSLSAYISSSFLGGRWNREEVDRFEKRIFNTFFKDKKLVIDGDAFPIEGFQFESWIPEDPHKGYGTAGGYSLTINGGDHPFSYRDGYLDYDKDIQ